LLNGVDGAGGVECVDGHEGLQIKAIDAERIRKVSENSIG
jgi:hypothetical protein